MAFTEKSNWVVLVVGVGTLIAYLAMVVPPALSYPIGEVNYQEPIVGLVIAYVLASIVGNIIAAASNLAEEDKKDQRDRDIDHFGGRFEYGFMVTAAIAALLLVMTKQDYFWIGNTLYLGGLTASLLGAVVKIAAYHGPFQRWLV